MRDNGVDMHDPASGQQGIMDALRGVEQDHDQATIDQAVATCEDLLPQFEHDRDNSRSDDEDGLAMVECLREQGLDVSDNLFESGRRPAPPEDIDQDELRSAMELCRDVVGVDRGGR